MFEFLSKLFDTSDFTPRWICGNWPEGLGWLHILSDLAVFGAYVAIPLVLGFFILRRRDIPFPRVLWLFVAFIFACGFGHLLEAVMFWQPVYRFSGLVKLITASVSWLTVIALIKIVPQALTLPGLKRLNKELQRQIEQRRLAQEQLQQQREWLQVTLSSIGDAVLTTDTQGRETFLNPVAEQLTGWDNPDARGVSLDDVFRIINESTRAPVVSPVAKVLEEGRIVGLGNHT